MRTADIAYFGEDKMFYLNPDITRKFDLKEANNFVRFWTKIDRRTSPVIIDEPAYDDEQQEISYLCELNVGKPLTQKNIIRLLRWVDSDYTHIERSGPEQGQLNKRAMNIIKKLDILNAFRSGKIKEDEFKRQTAKMVSANFMRLSLFNLCRPDIYPLVDRHTLRSYSCHSGTSVGAGFDFKRSWAIYQQYQKYFFQIATACGIEKPKKVNRDYIDCLMDVYDALYAFGLYLRDYGVNNITYFEIMSCKHRHL